MSIWFNFGLDVSKYSIEFNLFFPSFDFLFKNNLIKGVLWVQLGPLTVSLTDNKKINDWFETNYPIKHSKEEVKND